MSRTIRYFLWLACPLAALVFSPALAPAQNPSLVGIEVQTRGPVHEAFAAPVSQLPEQPAVAPKAPPPPVPELPPPERPEGDNVKWIGGYWAWDADKNDFLWISGTYRNAPPGQRYVSGYWEQSPAGYRWVSGFWASDSTSEMPYVQQPPQPLETGPSSPQPGDNSNYVPGLWVFRDNVWQWQPGYWQNMQPGYVWIPPHYVWTPGGFLLVPGYWDYPLDNRGLLFAPVYFNQPLWQTAGWYYQPNYCVRPSILFDSLFLRPGWGNYYFGDYYGARYAGLGFRPWIGSGGRYYDPLYNYARWQHRGDSNWLANQLNLQTARAAGRAALPPHTLAQQTAANRNQFDMVRPLNRLDGNVRLTRTTAAQVTAQRTAAEQLRQFGAARAKVEQRVGNNTVRSNTLNLANHPQPAGKTTRPAVAHEARPAPKTVAPAIHNSPPAHVAPPPKQHTAQHVSAPAARPAAPRVAQPAHVAAPRPAAAARPRPAPTHAAHAAPARHASGHHK